MQHLLLLASFIKLCRPWRNNTIAPDEHWPVSSNFSEVYESTVKLVLPDLRSAIYPQHPIRKRLHTCRTI